MRLAVGLCPDPLGRSSPDPLAVIRGGNGKERIGNREGEEGNGYGGMGGSGEMIGKGEGGLDLDMCPGAADQFLVTPPATLPCEVGVKSKLTCSCDNSSATSFRVRDLKACSQHTN